ncbi:hypothetical protein ACTXT7_014611 [Hymenolepis weldensis]
MSVGNPSALAQANGGYGHEKPLSQHFAEEEVKGETKRAKVRADTGPKRERLDIRSPVIP